MLIVLLRWSFCTILDHDDSELGTPVNKLAVSDQRFAAQLKAAIAVDGLTGSDE